MRDARAARDGGQRGLRGVVVRRAGRGRGRAARGGGAAADGPLPWCGLATLGAFEGFAACWRRSAARSRCLAGPGCSGASCCRRGGGEHERCSRQPARAQRSRTARSRPTARRACRRTWPHRSPWTARRDHAGGREAIGALARQPPSQPRARAAQRRAAQRADLRLGGGRAARAAPAARAPCGACRAAARARTVGVIRASARRSTERERRREARGPGRCGSIGASSARSQRTQVQSTSWIGSAIPCSERKSSTARRHASSAP